MDEVVGRGVYIREGNEHILSSEAFRSLWLLCQDSVVPPAIRPRLPTTRPPCTSNPSTTTTNLTTSPARRNGALLWAQAPYGHRSSSPPSFDLGNPNRVTNERAGTTTANLLGLDPKASDDLLKFVDVCLLPPLDSTKSLNTFRQSLCQDRIERALVVPMTYLLADNLHSKQLILQSRADLTDIKTHLTDVKLAIGQKTELNTTQKTSKTEITYLCKVKVSDPKRTDWENEAIRNEVVVHLKKHAPLKDFKSFFDNPSQAHTKALNQFICIQASYAKSTCRNHIKDTLSNSATVAMTMYICPHLVLLRTTLSRYIASYLAMDLGFSPAI
ncbi:hypothetical protein FB45DRAFT_865191 [Roridomyces roridus]|uniref:Uncharacterized protein n=1 Tax=Roridomyces roridus TaxID=1738132 RepID=A0AAD7BYI0_9AGAR|nr:hypothetical protein FB45DRAFT_865191 [Roridomyces roridus]